MIETTLIYLRKDNKILLGKKLRGHGMGKIVGVGGKFEEGETAEECAVRETFEETSVKITKFEEVGRVVYDNLHYKDHVIREQMHVFFATEWDGEPQDSDELDLEWYALRDMPYEKMWSDTKEYLPGLLQGKKLEAHFDYNEQNTFDDLWIHPYSDHVLATPKDSDFDLGEDVDLSAAPIKYGARVVLINDKKQICLTHALNKGYFKLPGGGREKCELAYENAIRETEEEAGYTIRDIVSLGRVIEYRSGMNHIHDSAGFLAYTEKFVGTKLEKDEIEDGTVTEWYDSIDDAISAVESMTPENCAESLSYRINFWKVREISFLRAAKQYLEHKTETAAAQSEAADEDFGTEFEE
jgi:8-oxo-dGTP diphosphatase